MIPFTLIMSVYYKESPEALARCLDSILAQTLLPDEFIVIKDGPLTEELDAVLEGFRYPGDFRIIALPQNVTQGPARAEGVKAARHEWVAVMDSDDICLPRRFEQQIGMIEENPELGLIGGQIAEFAEDPGVILGKRVVPTAEAEIYERAKKRNPFNQVTVMFRRALALEAGNYRYHPYFEDYDLWARMMARGVRCANHPDVLVNVGIGGGMVGRRRGTAYIRSEWQMQKNLRALGLVNSLEFARNVITRIPVRLLPEKWLARIYSGFARGKP